jgi:hypothetical protein
MHGPRLTPQEAVASVGRQVRRLEALGLDRAQAIRRAAAENGIKPEKVRWCAESAPGGSSARPTESGQGGYHPRPHGERGHSIHARKENTLRSRDPNRLLVNGLSPLASGRNFDVRQSSAPD